MDSRSCCLYVTAERVAEVKGLCFDVAARRSVTKRELQRLVGKMQFCAGVLPGARPFVRALIDALCGVQRNSHHIHISKAMRGDLRFWVRYFDAWNGRQQWHARADDVVVSTDASTVGDGDGGFAVLVEQSAVRLSDGWCVGAGAIGVWSHTHTDMAREVGWCELRAALFAMHLLAPQLRDRSIRIVMDNAAAVFMINRYRTRSARLLPLLRAMCGLCLQHNIEMRAVHRAGVDNVIADYLSRPLLHRFAPRALVHAGRSLRTACVVCSCQVRVARCAASMPPTLPLSTWSRVCRCASVRGALMRRWTRCT